MNTREEYFFDIVCRWCDDTHQSFDYDYNTDIGVVAFAYFSDWNGLCVSLYKSWEEVFNCLFEDDVYEFVTSGEEESPFDDYENKFLKTYFEERNNKNA